MPYRKVTDLIFPAVGMGTGIDIFGRFKQGDNNRYTSYLQPGRVRENTLGAVEGPGDLRDYVKRQTERCI